MYKHPFDAGYIHESDDEGEASYLAVKAISMGSDGCDRCVYWSFDTGFGRR